MKKKIRDGRISLKCPVCREYEVYVVKSHFDDSLSSVELDCVCDRCGSELLLDAKVELDEDDLKVIKRGESLIGDILDYLDKNKIYYIDTDDTLDVNIDIVNDKSEAMISIDKGSYLADITIDIVTEKKDEVKNYLENKGLSKSRIDIYDKSNLVSLETSAEFETIDDFKKLLDIVYEISYDVNKIDEVE